MTDAELIVGTLLEEIDIKKRLQRLADRQGLTLAELDAKVAEGRDDLSSLPIPASGKAYSRMKGKRGTDAQRKFRLFTRMSADLTNQGRIEGFKNRQVAKNPTFGGKM